MRSSTGNPSVDDDINQSYQTLIIHHIITTNRTLTIITVVWYLLIIGVLSTFIALRFPWWQVILFSLLILMIITKVGMIIAETIAAY